MEGLLSAGLTLFSFHQHPPSSSQIPPNVIQEEFCGKGDWQRAHCEAHPRSQCMFFFAYFAHSITLYCTMTMMMLMLGISILYSRCVYGKASHMKDFPHCEKCRLECHIFGVKKMW